MKIQLQRINDSKNNALAIASVPVLPGQSFIAPKGVTQQCVPVGFWPNGYSQRAQYTEAWKQGGWEVPAALPFDQLHPRRLLSLFEFSSMQYPQGAPESIDLETVLSQSDTSAPTTVMADSQDASEDTSPWSVMTTGKTVITKRTEKFFHHCVDQDGGLRLKFNDHELSLRAGWNCPNRDAWWQWVNAQKLWSGPLAQAWSIGGHIYAGKEDRFMTMEESVLPFNCELADEQMIMVKMYLVLYANGAIDMRLHYINGDLYGKSGAIKGKPMLWFEAPGDIHRSPKDQAWSLDTQAMQATGGHDDAAFTQKQGGVQWQPFDETRIVLGTHCNPITQELKPFEMVDSKDGFAAGVARTAVLSMAFGQAQNPARYLAAPSNYALAAEMMTPMSLPQESESDDKVKLITQLAQTARDVYLRNEMKQGFTRGGTYRYLDNYPAERWEFASDANETASFFRGAYLRQDAELYELGLRNADFIADLCCKHTDFVCRYHAAGEAQEIYSLIYMRFGGLVYSHLETGDPYYLEIAEAVGNRWLSTHRGNWPRKNIGRDAEPVEGLLLLHDYTGQDYYFDAARKIASDVVASLGQDGSWASGAGVGPFWGANALEGTPWNGAHLIAGIAEYIARADARDPRTVALLPGAKRLLGKWLLLLKAENYFHRASMSYAWRRQWAMATAINDDHLLAELQLTFDATLQEFVEKGDGFFKNGHHCASYVDAPYYYIANMLTYQNQS